MLRDYLSDLKPKEIQARLSIGQLSFSDFCKDIAANLDHDTILKAEMINEDNQHLQYCVDFPKFGLFVDVEADGLDVEMRIQAINQEGHTLIYMFDDFDGTLQLSSRKQQGREKCKDIKELIYFRSN